VAAGVQSDDLDRDQHRRSSVLRPAPLFRYSNSVIHEPLCPLVLVFFKVDEWALHLMFAPSFPCEIDTSVSKVSPSTAVAPSDSDARPPLTRFPKEAQELEGFH